MSSREQIEQNILEHLPQLVQLPELNLADMVRNDPNLLVENSEGRQPVPRNIDRYSFVPLTEIPGVERQNMLTESFYDMPRDVHSHYYGGRPRLDGPASLGIVVEKDGERHLCAVGSVRVEESGVLKIVQLQGVVTDGEIGPQLGGFRWPEAFIKGWETIASYVGATAIEVAYEPERVLQWSRWAEQGSAEAVRWMERYQKHYIDAPLHAGLTGISNQGTPRATVESRPMPVLGTDAIEGGDTYIGAVRRAIHAAADKVDFNRDGAAAKLALCRHFMYEIEQMFGNEHNDIVYSNFDTEVVEPFREALGAVDIAMDAIYELAEAIRRFDRRL